MLAFEGFCLILNLALLPPILSMFLTKMKEILRQHTSQHITYLQHAVQLPRVAGGENGDTNVLELCPDPRV